MIRWNIIVCKYIITNTLVYCTITHLIIDTNIMFINCLCVELPYLRISWKFAYSIPTLVQKWCKKIAWSHRIHLNCSNSSSYICFCSWSDMISCKIKFHNIWQHFHSKCPERPWRCCEGCLKKCICARIL